MRMVVISTELSYGNLFFVWNLVFPEQTLGTETQPHNGAQMCTWGRTPLPDVDEDAKKVNPLA